MIKIAKIVNEYTFIINAGISQGIEEGDKFEIIQVDDFEVKDPDTNQVLGVYNLKKGEIIAEQVHQNFTICKTETYNEERLNPLSSITSSGLFGSKMVTTHRKLDVNEDQITGGMTPEPIKIGDIVQRME